ncbi:MAG: RNA methyltransferase [Lautropia sp.]|nr:RNA methyltransferase [Lautropia sp.]
MSDPIVPLLLAWRKLKRSPVDIGSAANPRYRQLRELLDSARERRRSGLTVLEGWHLLDSWLQQGGVVQTLVLPRRTVKRLHVGDRPAGTAIVGGRDADMNRMSVTHGIDTGRPAVQRSGAVPGSDPGQKQGADAREGAVPADRRAADRASTERREAAFSLLSARWLILEDPLFDSLDILPSPAPVLALVETPKPMLPARIEGQDVVILDRVQDPGNVGTIIRTVAAAGIQQIITTPGTAACWSPKVLRAGMGGHFVLDLFESVSYDALQSSLKIPLAATILRGGQSLYETDLRPALAWVFGNEGEGVDPRLLQRLERGVTIPQLDTVESLNVAASAAVCLFEQRRQRSKWSRVPGPGMASTGAIHTNVPNRANG